MENSNFFKGEFLFGEWIVNTKSLLDAFEEWKWKFIGIKEGQDSNPGQFSGKPEPCSLR